MVTAAAEAVNPGDRATVLLGSAALVAALTEAWPAAYRLAAGLTGRADAAGAVAARVLDRAGRPSAHWRTAEQVHRWFTRYTVLTARRVLRDRGDDVGLGYLAALTPQQREAFVLHHGLGLDLHRTAAAMDCSSRAASTHLVAAAKRLTADGVDVTARAVELPATLAAVVPPPAVVSAAVARAVARRRWRTWGRRAVVLGIVAALVWVAAFLWQTVVVL